MKVEVTSAQKENVGGPVPGKRLLVNCGPTEDDPALRNLSFSVPWTDENRSRYAVGNIFDVSV